MSRTVSDATSSTQRPLRPLPDPEYVDFAPFWAGTAVGELRVPACTHCARNIWPPRMACPGCAGIDLAWQTVGNRGVLYSWTRIGRAMIAGFETEVPYTVVIVESESDPRVRFVGRLAPGHDHADVDPVMGAELEAVFVTEGEVCLVHWRPVSG